MVPQVARLSKRPIHFVCPSCQTYLVSWDPPTGTVEIFYKVGLWSDFWTGDVRMICQRCLGATDQLPAPFVALLRQRLGLAGTPEPAQREKLR